MNEGVSADFAEDACRLAAICAQMLGWRPDEFWQATPADLRLALGPIELAPTGMTASDCATLLERDKNG